MTKKQLKTSKTITLGDFYVLTSFTNCNPICSDDQLKMVYKFVYRNRRVVLQFSYEEYEDMPTLFVNYRYYSSADTSQDVSRVLDTLAYFQKILHLGFFVDITDDDGNIVDSAQVKICTPLSRELGLCPSDHKFFKRY